MNRRQWVYAASSIAAGGLIGSQGAIGAPESNTESDLPTGARVPVMKFVYDCDATLSPAIPFGDTLDGTRRIIPITGGTVKGPRIRGEVLKIGADEPFFMFTTPVFEAPAGKYAWLNRSIFVATLGARPKTQNAVLIRVFQVV
jgi:hypothetical protein